MKPKLNPGWMLVSRLKPLRKPIDDADKTKIKLPDTHFSTLTPYIVEQSASTMYPEGDVIALREVVGQVPNTLELGDGVIFGVLHETQVTCGIEVGEEVKIERYHYNVEMFVKMEKDMENAADKEQAAKLLGV